MKHRLLWLFCVLSIGMGLSSQELKPLVCGIATGFPPYQYMSPTGEPVGMDAEITLLVFKKMGKRFIFKQSAWDTLLLNLMHQSGSVDLLCGTEISKERQLLLDFSIPYYQRKSQLFVLSSSPFQKSEDLFGHIITGDRNSLVEQNLEKNKIRIMATDSKEISFQLLAEKKVDGVIAPYEVGTYIAKGKGLSIRILANDNPGTPVGFAVAKGNQKLAKELSDILKKLQLSGELAAIIKKYR